MAESQARTRVPAVDGWFTMDEKDPRLLGSRCRSCGTFFFPRASFFCRNPDCDGTEFDGVPLSSRGRVWSFTTNRYPPPPPFVATEPFEPYTIAAVQLAEEKLVVLGQVVAASEDEPRPLEIGSEVEMVLDTLYTDDDHEYVVWKWSPV